MRIHSFQHVPFEDIGSLARDIERLGYSHSVTHWYKGDTPPPIDQIDLLIVMGGPMGANDEKIYPWIKDEKKMIAKATQQGKKILGICLGAQLIAAVLGAEVKRNSYLEIGWFPLTIPVEAKDSAIAKILSNTRDVFHWHGDTFDLPPTALHLATSNACMYQAFSIGNQIFGFQFHLETTEHSAQALITHCGDELDNSLYVQSANQIMENHQGFLEINRAMSQIFQVIVRG